MEKCQDAINYIRFLWCIGNDKEYWEKQERISRVLAEEENEVDVQAVIDELMDVSDVVDILVAKDHAEHFWQNRGYTTT